MRRQRTLAEPVSCSGVGLHSGRPASLTLRPAAPDAGIVFECPGGVQLPARVARVVASARATSLGAGSVRVATVEHVLAALHGLGVDNARVVVDGGEVPAMDGSAAAFVYLVRTAGLVEQPAAVRVLRVRKPVEIVEGAHRIRVERAADFRVTYGIDFAHPCIGRQRIEFRGDDPVRFEREIAGARTFGFLRDADRLRGAGQAQGSALSNTIVLDAVGVLNPDGLRSPDEFVRHKVLDLLGDLALLGARLQGHVIVERGGHALHLRLVRALASAARSAGRSRLSRWRDRAPAASA